MSVNDSEDVIKCEDCVVGKLSRLNTKNKSNHKVSETLACVHSDLCSLPTKSYNGSKYFITFLDEKTHFVVLYVLNSKDQALAAFKHYPAFAERDTGKKLKTIRTENGGEYTSTDWNTYCLTSGITHSRGPPHSPQLHGKAERFNRTLLDKILPSLFHTALPTRFWEAAARHAVSAYNITPTRTNEGKGCPYSIWKLKPASYTSMRAFGCKVLRLITGPTQGGKLSAKASSCVYPYALPDGDGCMVCDTHLCREVN